MVSGDALIYEAAKKALSDFRYFCRRCFHIRRKDGTVGTLELNPVQERLYATVRKMQAEGRPVRVVVLKARQMGVSTFVGAYLLWRLLRGDYVLNALQVAHDRESARYLLSIISFAVELLPEWFRLACGIETRYFTKYEIVFEHNHCGIEISSADSVEPGRGKTLHLVHLSEAAFYEDADTLTKSLSAAIPDSPVTAVLVESTGQGPSGYFFDLFTRASKGLNDYIALFYPWYEHPEYRKPVPEGVEVYCPPELEHLYAEGKITKEQLYWRQWKIENDFNGDEDKFKVEYPCSVEEAFLAESATLFHIPAVEARLREVEQLEPEEGFLVRATVEGPITFVQQKGERLKGFRRPEPGRVYVIGADTGSGVVVNRQGDFSSADVLDVATGEQVAHLHAICEPASFAQDLMLLGSWYNNALIAVEADGHGLSVLTWLRDSGYYNLYRRKVFDKLSNQWVDKLGWSTNKRTKKLIIDSLRADFRNGSVIINDKVTLNEMKTFVKLSDKTDEIGALPGAKDDSIISMAIAAFIRREVMPFAPSARVEEQKKEQEAQPADLQGTFAERRMRIAANRSLHPELGAFY